MTIQLFFLKKESRILTASTVKDGGIRNYSSSLGALEWYVVMILLNEMLLDLLTLVLYCKSATEED